MCERRTEDIRQAIDGELSGVGSDPFLYQRILNLAQKEPRRHFGKMTVAFVVLALLLLSTAAAVAGNWLGVKWFLTDRLMNPVNVEEAYVVYPAAQSFDSERINLHVMDAYWYDDVRNDKLDLTMHVDVNDSSMPFCMDNEIGTDGESFDMIWWHGNVMPVEEWLAGRSGYVMDIWGAAEIDGVIYYGGYDHVLEEQGITLMLELRDPPDLSEGATLNVEIITHPIAPSPDSYGGYVINYDDRETAVLTITLPPMTKGPAKEIDWANEPNA